MHFWSEFLCQGVNAAVTETIHEAPRFSAFCLPSDDTQSQGSRFGDVQGGVCDRQVCVCVCQD